MKCTFQCLKNTLLNIKINLIAKLKQLEAIMIKVTLTQNIAACLKDIKLHFIALHTPEWNGRAEPAPELVQCCLHLSRAVGCYNTAVYKTVYMLPPLILCLYYNFMK